MIVKITKRVAKGNEVLEIGSTHDLHKPHAENLIATGRAERVVAKKKEEKALKRTKELKETKETK